MNLHPRELVCGVAPEILRACAQWLCMDSDDAVVTREDIAIGLGAPLSESNPVIEQMVVAGYFKPTDDGCFAVTPSFVVLRAAKISPGIRRAEAQQLLAKAIARAREINAAATDDDPTISVLGVFGSYLSDKPLLGDLDLMIGVANPRAIDRVHDWDRVWREQDRLRRSMYLRRPEKIGVHSVGEVLRMRAPYHVLLGEISKVELAGSVDE